MYICMKINYINSPIVKFKVMASLCSHYFIGYAGLPRRTTGISGLLDFELKKVLLPPPPLGNFADISYLKENFKPHLLRDVCTLCSGALVSDSL